MKAINNTTNPKGKSNEPYGIQLLKANPKTEEEAVKGCQQCCDDYPFGCKREAECARLYDTQSENWQHREKVTYTPKRQTQEEKYADWLGQLSLRTALSTVRERAYY